MTKRIFSAALGLTLGCLVAACGGSTSEPSAPLRADVPDSLALVAQQVQQVARLYTTEYRVHKIVTQHDRPRLSGSVLGADVDIPLPAERTIAVPIDVTVKAYIDFSRFSAANVERHGDTFALILPDPVIVVTAAKIDNAALRQYSDLFGSRYTDAEMLALARQGEDSVVAHIDRGEILRTARHRGTRILLPILKSMGFPENRLTIAYRDDLRKDELKLEIEKAER